MKWQKLIKNLYHTLLIIKVNEHKRDMDKMTEELHEVKRKYYEQKRKETVVKKIMQEEKYLLSVKKLNITIQFQALIQ